MSQRRSFNEENIRRLMQYVRNDLLDKHYMMESRKEYSFTAEEIAEAKRRVEFEKNADVLLPSFTSITNKIQGFFGRHEIKYAYKLYLDVKVSEDNGTFNLIMRLGKGLMNNKGVFNFIYPHSPERTKGNIVEMKSLFNEFNTLVENEFKDNSHPVAELDMTFRSDKNKPLQVNQSDISTDEAKIQFNSFTASILNMIAPYIPHKTCCRIL